MYGDGASECWLLALAQESEKLDALAQPPTQDLRAPDHFASDGGDLRCAEIEALVEIVHRLENLGMGQMRVTQRCDLRAAFGRQLRILVDEPMVLQRLLVEERTGIRRRKGNLDRVRVDLDGETDGFLDGLLGLARKTE